VYARTSQVGLREARMDSRGSGEQPLMNPNCSPVGLYLIWPIAAPYGAAGSSQRHTDASPDGQSEMVVAVLLRWYASCGDEPMAFISEISTSCRVKLACSWLIPISGRVRTTVRFPSAALLLIILRLGASRVPAGLVTVPM
jgi:hypothetical protein